MGNVRFQDAQVLMKASQPASPTASKSMSLDDSTPGSNYSSWEIQLQRRLVFPFWLMDARKKFNWMVRHLSHTSKSLELGSGMGSLVHVLREEGFDVVACDVADHSVRYDLAPVLYDGNRTPFDADSFDVCILSTVLHHVPNPDLLIEEALRVAPKVIIIEDIYSSSLQRQITEFADSLLNWEFEGHPHSNRNDEAWRDCFDRLNTTLIHAQSWPVGLIFRQAIYVLSRKI